MYTECKKLRVDRIEEGIAVAFSEDGTEYRIPQELAAVRESDILMATIHENSEIAAIEVLPKETAAKKSALRSRLKKLFNK